jgi:hypothetical protein
MIISFPLEITTPKKRYHPIGRCIYGEGKEHRGKLTEEHIVPFGIAGDSTVLPASSCRSCAKITGKVEQRCLREMLGHFRIAIGSPTRRPKERPKNVEIKTGHFNKEATEVENVQTITIFPTEIIVLPMFTFPGAGLLESRSPAADVEFQLSLFRLENQLEDFSRKHGAILSPALYPVEFVRMIAKIAHSYAVAELGPDGFRPYLLDLILGRIPDLNSCLQWIGCEPKAPPPSGDLFSIRWDKCFFEKNDAAAGSPKKQLLMVQFRLFPFFNTPLYHVVVGEWDS